MSDISQEAREAAEKKPGRIMKDPTHYVAGFMFNEDRTRVALIEKQKPDWQRGKLNGIGGKIEDDESPVEAMTSEGSKRRKPCSPRRR